MGQKRKRGQAGNAVQYITRNQALKKLHLKLSEFRRLCILKGIHPREPKKKTQGQNKTYYHVKDINYLAHEPLLVKFRDAYAYEKKIRKAKAKKNRDLAERLLSRRPHHRIDHLVKERYPSFVDALRDLDDPLTMVHLFATLPAEKALAIPAKAVHTARRLAMEFQAYVVRTAALRKVFVSVKGFYYQAEIMGQAVTWLVPHSLSQTLPADVDYRVMLTFLEFYQTLLQFVNFKLYHMLGLKYPPVMDARLEQAAAGLAAIMQDLAQPSIQGVAAVHGAASAVSSSTLALPAAAQHQSVHQQPGAEVMQLGEDGRTGGGAAAQAAEPAEADAGADVSDDEDLGGIDSGADSDDDASEDDESDEDEDADADMDATAAPGAARSAQQQQSINDAGPMDTDNAQLASTEQQDAAQAEDATAAGPAGIAGGATTGDSDAEVCEKLFSGLVFFLGREVPREQLLFVIRAFGGMAAWEGEGSPLAENDESITHQVVDRPAQGHRFLSREYVQPQWVFDSANFRVLVHPDKYAPGLPPPPHLSPFVGPDDDDYVPDYLQELRKLQEAAKAARARSQGLQEDRFVGEEDEAAGVRGPAGADLDSAEAAEKLYAAELSKELQAADPEAAGEDADEEPEPQQPEEAAQPAAPAQQSEADAMKNILMPRKTKKLYDNLQKQRSAKKARVEKLTQKKQALARVQKEQ